VDKVLTIEDLSEDQLLTLAYCRDYDQYVAMVKDYLADKCPFCDPMNEELNHIIRESRGWRLWVSAFPIKNSELHLVMAPRYHVASVDDMTASDFTDMGRLFMWARKKFKLIGGGFAMRFGSPKLSTCSVLHLHANVIVPNRKGNVRVTLAKEPQEIAEQLARSRVFEKLRLGTELASLDPAEFKLVEGRV
jgi:diadenosine tetraphosphate (Ap4A) HIT family hydrolase